MNKYGVENTAMAGLYSVQFHCSVFLQLVLYSNCNPRLYWRPRIHSQLRSIPPFILGHIVMIYLICSASRQTRSAQLFFNFIHCLCVLRELCTTYSVPLLFIKYLNETGAAPLLSKAQAAPVYHQQSTPHCFPFFCWAQTD